MSSNAQALFRTLECKRPPPVTLPLSPLRHTIRRCLQDPGISPITEVFWENVATFTMGNIRKATDSFEMTSYKTAPFHASLNNPQNMHTKSTNCIYIFCV
ncbi:unnamed protein product [Caretta caretta]